MSEEFRESLYYDIRADLAPWVKFLIIIGGRGIGKTFSSFELLTTLSDINPFYVRTIREEIELSCTTHGNPFKEFNRKKNKNFGFEKEQGFYVMKDFNKEKEEQKIGLGISLASTAKVRGMSFPECEYILWDEFIPKKNLVVRFNEGFEFKDFYETVNRNRELEGREPVHAILLSNSNDIRSKTLIEFGIDADVEQMVRHGINRRSFPSKGIRVVLPDTSEFEAYKSKTALYQAGGGSYNDMALKNKFTDVSFVNVGKRKLSEYKIECAIDDMYVYRHKHFEQYYVTHSRADCERYTTKDSKMLFVRRYYMMRDEMLDGTFVYETYAIKTAFRELFNI